MFNKHKQRQKQEQAKKKKNPGEFKQLFDCFQ